MTFGIMHVLQVWQSVNLKLYENNNSETEWNMKHNKLSQYEVRIATV